MNFTLDVSLTCGSDCDCNFTCVWVAYWLVVVTNCDFHSGYAWLFRLVGVTVAEFHSACDRVARVVVTETVNFILCSSHWTCGCEFHFVCERIIWHVYADCDWGIHWTDCWNCGCEFYSDWVSGLCVCDSDLSCEYHFVCEWIIRPAVVTVAGQVNWLTKTIGNIICIIFLSISNTNKFLINPMFESV